MLVFEVFYGVFEVVVGLASLVEIIMGYLFLVDDAEAVFDVFGENLIDGLLDSAEIESCLFETFFEILFGAYRFLGA